MEYMYGELGLPRHHSSVQDLRSHIDYGQAEKKPVILKSGEQQYGPV